MADRFDLTRVRLRHYRSIAGCNVALGPLTLLVGPNGSGKSNFLDALRLTAQALTETLDNALRERGGIGEVRRRSRGHPTHFGISLDFSSPGAAGSYAFEVGAVRGGDFRVSRETCRVTRSDFGSDDQYFTVRDGTLTECSESVMPPAPTDRLYLVAAAGIPAFRPIYDGLSAINVYSLNPDAMRKLQPPDPGDLLRRDGANVASVLERLRQDRPEIKAKVEEYLARVVTGVTRVDRRAYGAWEALEFRQKVAGDQAPWAFQATSISDGTLRALGVLVALFAPGPGTVSPVGIEEPEVALHPAAAGLLLDALRDASLARQVLVTTHSPDLLDTSDLQPSELLAVRSDNGVTKINAMDRAGRRAMRESLFTAGELLRADQMLPEEDSSEQVELFS